MLFLFAIFLGIVAGLLTGGKLGNLGRIRFRWPWLVVLAVLVRGAVLLTPLNRFEGAQYVYVLSLAAIGAWTAVHWRRLPGVWIVTVGSALNLLVIVANGGRMPVAPELAGSALLDRGAIGQYTLMGPDTHLNWLGDWVALRPLPEAYSPGDLLIAIGIALVILVTLHRRPESDGVIEKPENV